MKMNIKIKQKLSINKFNNEKHLILTVVGRRDLGPYHCFCLCHYVKGTSTLGFRGKIGLEVFGGRIYLDELDRLHRGGNRLNLTFGSLKEKHSVERIYDFEKRVGPDLRSRSDNCNIILERSFAHPAQLHEESAAIPGPPGPA